jgi:hypothetical protein
MKNNNAISIFLTVLIASAAIIGGAYAFKNFIPDSRGPEKTVRDFYKEWTDYEGNPMMAGVHRGSVYLSSDYARKVDGIIDSFDGGGFDPVLCAQDIPERIDFISTEINGDNAVVTIEEFFSGNAKTVKISLVNSGKGWVISDIACEKPLINGDAALREHQNKVGGYIRENINELSPEKAVLGGTFQVVSIKFTKADTCLVEYEDGHIALSAEAVFGDDNGIIDIKSFTIIEDDQKQTNNFNKTGNLTKNNDLWTLVYEEPGKPALSAKLKFSSKTVCLDEGQKKSCAPEYWSVGDRVEITGQKNNDEVEVLNFSRIRAEEELNS